MDNDLFLVCKIYESKLREVLTETEFMELSHFAFRMLVIDSAMRSEEGDWKDFQMKIARPTEEELEAYKKLKEGE